jgi:hypothetical protein
MKKSKKPLPPLEKGQLWKIDTGYIQIWDIGKTLVDYKMMKQWVLAETSRWRARSVRNCSSFFSLERPSGI